VFHLTGDLNSFNLDLGTGKGNCFFYRYNSHLLRLYIHQCTLQYPLHDVATELPIPFSHISSIIIAPYFSSRKTISLPSHSF
jgi:hypothetical protein